IAEGTVKVHVKHLLRKLGLRSRVEAAVWYVEQCGR
ncbi:MAG: two-component system response regulator NarL, partial [Thiothrix sp.]|nr:two-component system response regulator NarL [Thiothrix sp.]